MAKKYKRTAFGGFEFQRPIYLKEDEPKFGWKIDKDGTTNKLRDNRKGREKNNRENSSED